MAITINDFRAIANGTHNVGEITISGTGANQSLAKVNNHVWRTSLNNVQLTAAQNLATRRALVEALTQNRTPNMDLYRELLLGEGRGTQALSRDFVKSLLDKTLVPNRAGQLARTATVGDMVVKEKSLRERRIELNGTRTEGVTSNKEAAWTLDVNDRIDKGFRRANSGLARIRQIGGDALQFSAAAVDVFTGFRNAVSEDTRLTPQQRTAFSEALSHENIIAKVTHTYNSIRSLGGDLGLIAMGLVHADIEGILNHVLGDREIDNAIREDYLARLAID